MNVVNWKIKIHSNSKCKIHHAEHTFHTLRHGGGSIRLGGFFSVAMKQNLSWGWVVHTLLIQCKFVNWFLHLYLLWEQTQDESLVVFCVFAVADSSSNWAVCGKSSGLVLMPTKANATHKVQIEVMPLFAGHLPFPKIKVLKYLPHTAAPAPPPDPGKTFPHPKTTNVVLNPDQIYTWCRSVRFVDVPELPF